MSLLHLQFSWYSVQAAILEEMSSCMLEVKRHTGSNTLFADVEHPFVITYTAILSRLATNSDLLTPRPYFPMEVDGFQKRFTDNCLVLDGEFAKE